jgi:hypothetical protein
MIEYKTISEIKQAVDKGKRVFADTESYIVIKDTSDNYLIKYIGKGTGDWYCGLHGREGTKYENQLNANKFYSL